MNQITVLLPWLRHHWRLLKRDLHHFWHEWLRWR